MMNMIWQMFSQVEYVVHEDLYISSNFSSLDIGTIKRFEPEFYQEIEKNTNGKVPDLVFFNKGL
jgi:hypothetical protein